jgi:hypothetical protein
MEQITVLSREDFDGLLTGKIGLVVGGEFTKGPDLWTDLSRVFGFDGSQCYWDLLADPQLRAQGSEQTCAAVRKFIESRPNNPQAEKLAQLKWAAVLSLCLDDFFDRKLSEAVTRRGAGADATIISELNRACPPRSTPVFKLLGSLERPSFACTQISYAKQKALWPGALKDFADRVRHRPVLCVGALGSGSLLVDLLSAITSNRSISPTHLIFPAEDLKRLPEDMIELLEGRTRIAGLKFPLSDLMQSIKAAEKSFFTPPLGIGTKNEGLRELQTFSDLVASVAEQITTPISAEEKNRLQDLLFSPTIPRWDPFVYDLDFRRTLANDMTEWLALQVRNPKEGLRACSLTGNSASGKTTLLKRVAYDLAKRGFPVFWFKPWFYPDAQRVIQEFFKALARNSALNGKLIFVFMDDPLALGGLTAFDIGNAARAAGISPFLVTSARQSDWAIHERGDLIGDFHILREFDVPDNLDDGEWKALPTYLLKLGIATSPEDAQSRVAMASSRAARDTLSMLYWLLPSSRKKIEASVQDEYFRLGDRAGLTKVIIGGIAKTSALLKEAYEMVAVANNFGTALPIEVLVNALNVGFGEWIDATAKENVAWGLFYEEENSEQETISYRTRNSVVTDILIEAINGGKLAHAAEVQIMRRLLAACSGTAPAYREFCIRSLVPWSKNKDVEYEEGLTLYETALQALPNEDKTLVHHKGLWIKNKGNDPIEAKRVFQHALALTAYPYATRSEANEHIHTSLAAATVDAIDQGKQSAQEGKLEVLEHLSRASSEQFTNFNAVHVKANLLIRLIDKLEDKDDPDSLHLVNEGIVDIDRSLILLSNPLEQGDRVLITKEIGMLQDARGKILGKMLPVDELKIQAEQIWLNHKRQDGFVLVCRKLFQIASEKNKGNLFNDAFNYFTKAAGFVVQKEILVRPELAQVGIDIYYHWRVNRYSGATTDPIRWDFLADTTITALKSPTLLRGCFYRFVRALSLAHLGRWPESLALFNEIRQGAEARDQLWKVRAALLSSNGERARVQGIIKETAGKKYLHVESLHQDFYTNREEAWPKNEEIAHAYILFSFAGPRAYREI